MTIRPAVPEDAPGIARVHVGSWRAAYRGIVPQAHLDNLDVGEREQQWSQRLAGAESPRHVLVATDDGEVVGFASAGPTRDDDAAPGTAEVYAIYLDPDWWGRRVGTLLLAAITDRLANLDPAPPRVTIWALRDNERARRLYESAGFCADGGSTTVLIGGLELAEVRYARDARATTPSRPDAATAQ